jgi:1,4-dihydroxy-2-naphthoyl-CoA hydrolase
MSCREFEYRFTVRLDDTDAAGVLYFGRLFRHAHGAYEAMLQEIGWGLERILLERRFLLPLVHCEADFHRPLRLGEPVVVRLGLTRLGEHSFHLRYRFTDPQGGLSATLSSVHTCSAADFSGKRPLPAELRAALRGRLCGGEEGDAEGP